MADPVVPPRRGEAITPGGSGTNRFHEWMERLTVTTNSNNEAVESGNVFSSALSRINALENRIGSGDFLTSDETGFTVDTDKLSADMDEA